MPSLLRIPENKHILPEKNKTKQKRLGDIFYKDKFLLAWSNISIAYKSCPDMNRFAMVEMEISQMLKGLKGFQSNYSYATVKFLKSHMINYSP